MALQKELEAQSETENIRQGLGAILEALHESSFPVLARNLQTDNFNIEGIHVERGGVPRKVVVLHTWGATSQEPEARLVVIGFGEGSDHLRSLSMQTRNPQQVKDEAAKYTIGPSVDIDEYTQENRLSNLRKWVKGALLGETMQQDHLIDLSSSVNTLNKTHLENSLNNQKISSIVENVKS